MATIRSVRDNMQGFIRLQNEILKAVGSQISQTQEERNADDQALRMTLNRFITPNNYEIFDALTAVAKSAKRRDNFTAYVRACEKRDTENREEKRQLIDTHGSVHSLQDKAEELREEIDLIDSVLPVLRDEIEAFDETLEEIKEHNEKYPKSMIKDGDGDKYKNGSGFVNWFFWATRINPGPYNAFRTLDDYTDDYGDFFVDARNIQGLRDNLKEQETNREALATEYSRLTTILDRIDALDSTYKGPDQIALDVASQVFGILMQDDGFTTLMAEDIDVADARHAAHLVAKIHAFDNLASRLEYHKAQASHNLSELKEPMDVLKAGVSVVPLRSVSFEFYGIENSVRGAADTMRKSLRDAAATRSEIDDFEPESGFGYASLKELLLEASEIKIPDTEFSLDFTSLTTQVASRIAEYKREQELERQRREAERKAAAERLRKMRQSYNNSSSGTSSISIGRTRTGSNNVFGGSTGISRRR